jgi:serine/threonine protein kinase
MNGIDYMHKEGVYHRDLKLENILLNEELELMIADFGLSIKRIKMESPYANEYVGTPP